VIICLKVRQIAFAVFWIALTSAFLHDDFDPVALFLVQNVIDDASGPRAYPSAPPPLPPKENGDHHNREPR
jgi:hypothetical protein